MAKKVIVKINELTKKHNISLRELSRLADVRHAALSELSNGKRENINFSHIERIAEALDISDIREIVDLVEDRA
jgi:DNA-binding Xre family transcriptional regulator